MSWSLIIQFAVLMIVLCGVIIFMLYMALIRTVDGAKQRLDREAEAARKKEAELSQKIKEVDAQLLQRKKELDVMEKKMRQELEEQSAKQREEIIVKARTEAEEIITKAQNAREQIKKELEKNLEIKSLNYSVQVLSDVLTKAAKESLEKQLFMEFMEQLKNVDFSRIGMDIKSADIITSSALDVASMNAISSLFKEKLGRELKFNPKIDKMVVHGVIIQFESLILDGSLQNALKDAASAIRQQLEKQYA